MNLSSPYRPATRRAETSSISSKSKVGFELTVPAKRKFMFISAPPNAASPVNTPKMRATPTANSPKATRCEMTNEPGRPMFSIIQAYQSETSGCSPAVFVKAPVRNPFTAPPAPVPTQAELVTFPQPASSQTQPTYTLTTSHNHAIRGLDRKSVVAGKRVDL